MLIRRPTSPLKHTPTPTDPVCGVLPLLLCYSLSKKFSVGYQWNKEHMFGYLRSLAKSSKAKFHKACKHKHLLSMKFIP